MLAIVIPYYKLSFFEKTLQSLSQQTDKRFNVYIGNDASPENPSSVLEKYKTLLDFNYKLFENNLGSVSLVKQWERCIGMLKDEDWMLILGDDDTLSQNCVEAFYKNLEDIENQNISVVRFSTKIINENDAIISDVFSHPKTESSIDFLFRRLKGGTRSSLSEYVFKTANVRKYGFKNLPLAWHADDLAILEFSEFGTIFTINEAKVNFRRSGQNITSFRHDMVIKNKATFDYYYYLLHEKNNFFNSKQLQILNSKLEKSFLNDKKNSYFWMKLTKMHLFSFNFKSYFLLLYKILYQGFKSKK